MTNNTLPANNYTFDELLRWVRLSLVEGLGAQTFCQLLKRFGHPDAVLNASITDLQSVISEKIALVIKNNADESQLEKTRDWLKQADNFIITLADARYPQALLEISDPPPLLYAKGNVALLNQISIAVVGSRSASVQGEKNAHAFAFELAQSGLTIVSGMALGIDGAAHKGALAATGATIAVVGTGLDIVYPAKHRDLAHEIAKRGLIISEFPLGTPSMAKNFPKRNRIISGLSLGCLVVEANLQSGSQIIARLAGEQGREVFAIPGSIHSPTAKGCHQLIKQGAKLVDCIQDILEEINWENVISASKDSAEDIAETHPILQHIGYEPTSLGTIVQLSSLSVNEVSATLMMLELEGKVASLAGGKYQKISG